MEVKFYPTLMSYVGDLRGTVVPPVLQYVLKQWMLSGKKTSNEMFINENQIFREGAYASL